MYSNRKKYKKKERLLTNYAYKPYLEAHEYIHSIIQGQSYSIQHGRNEPHLIRNRSFIVEPCIDKSIISTNQLMHILLKTH